MKKNERIKRMIPILAGMAILASCRESSIGTDIPDISGENDAVINLAPVWDTDAQSTRSATEIDESEIIASNGVLVVRESVSALGLSCTTCPGTKGTPATTDNFADLYKEGFRGFAVYAGKQNRSDDLAATFVHNGESNIWSHFYQNEVWPEDNRLLFYYTAPNEIPSYIEIGRTSDAADEAHILSFSIKGDYPVRASDQKDILFAANEVTVVRGGVSVYNPVHFKHVFTAVKFEAGDNGTAKIEGVKLTNMPSSGSCRLSLSGSAHSSESVEWTHPETTQGRSDFMCTVSDGNALFCIPQTFHSNDDISLLIEYTVGGSKETAEIDFGKAMNGRTWLAGQLYTYTLSIGDLGVSVSDVSTEGTINDVVITNTGKLESYIRVAFSADWMRDAAGETSILRNCDPYSEGTFLGLAVQNWVKNGGYYYYRLPVKAGMATVERIFTSYTAGTVPAKASGLDFTIMAQAVPFDKSKKAAAYSWGEEAAGLLSTSDK